MTRRDLLKTALFAIPGSSSAGAPLVVPVLRLLDRNARCDAAQIQNFYSAVWEEADRNFRRCGIVLQTVERTCEIRKHVSGHPRFEGLDRSVVNVVLTDYIPLDWDNGRGLGGVATINEGCPLCVIAMKYAHPHRIPLIAVNTLVHELLHIFFQDIFVARGGLIHSQAHELRVDWYATRLWLFGASDVVRESTEAYLARRK